MVPVALTPPVDLRLLSVGTFSSSVALEIEIFLSLQNISMQESVVVRLTYKYSCVVLLQWMR